MNSAYSRGAVDVMLRVVHAHPAAFPAFVDANHIVA